MNYKKVLIAFVLFAIHSWTSYGQVIVSDGLNNSTSLFTLSGGAYYTGNSVTGDRPATSPFAVEGTHSRGVINGTASLTSSDINTASYTGISTTFRLASFSIGSTSNGADGTDIVTVEISPDGGVTYYSTVRVLGNSNAYWAYSTGAGVASTPYDGNTTPVDFAPASGGNRTTDGYSTVTVTGLPAVSNLRVRITMLNNATAEQWVIDDFKVLGTLASCTTPTTQATAITSNGVTTTGANLSWTDGAGSAGTLVSLRVTPNTLTPPAASTNYTPTLNFSTASGANLIDANNVVVAKNNTGSVTGITGLTPATQYTATPYAYNGSGSSVCFNTTNPESFNFYTLALEPTTPTGSFSACSSGTNSISLTFTAANTITNASGYVLIYREATAPTSMPVDGTIYAPGSTIGTSTFYNFIASTATTINVTGLNGGTAYYFALIPYGSYLSVPETINYRTGTLITTNCTTSPAPEINVKGIIGSNPSIVDGDTTPSSLDNTLYGTLVVGNSSIPKTFRIENTGNLPLTISGLTMVGGNSGDFVASGASIASFPFTIAAGAFVDFNVTFTPSGAGTRNTTLTIANNDSNENPYDFLIQGTGTATSIVEINVKGNGQSIPDNSIYPQGTNWTAFGLATVGVSTVTRTFTIENLGSTALLLTGASPYVQITGAGASSFSVTATPSSSIAGNSTTTFDVTFNPASPGTKNATIVIANNDSDENPYNFNISGNAKGTNNIYVTGNGNDVVKGSLTTSTTNLTNFGLIPVTTGVKQNTFVISNFSSSPTYLSNVTISGADASMFTIVAQPNNGTVASGNNTSFTLNFTPTSAGVKNATVTFNAYTDASRTSAYLDPIDGTFTFAISGEGIIYTPCSNNAVQTIVQQDFEASPATPVWAYSSTTDGAVAITGGTFNNGSGAVNGYIGAQSYQFKGIGTTTTRSAVITLSSVDVSQYNNINFSMRVGAFRASGTTQGLDVNDLIQVETSIDGGVNWSVESVLKGYTNSRWSFAATGVFNAYYTGNNSGVTYDTRLGNAELTTTGISTYNVKNLPQATNLLIRITLNVDRDDELWALDNIKLEGQTAQATTWNGSSWSAGFPTPSTKAIFDGDYTTTVAASHGSIETCECQIKAGRNVTVDSGYYMEIQSDLKNAGNLTIANNGSLIQINDAASNIGNVTYQRTASGIRGYDYVYWSSPVAGQSVTSIYSTPTPGYIYRWDALANNINSPLSSGNWLLTSGTMNAGNGYIVRGSNNYNLTATNIAGAFSGEVNNGVIPVTISRGTNTTPSSVGSGNGITITNYDDNWNLIGNPYPSSIKAVDFLAANTNIQGFVYLWTHGTAPFTTTNPFYGSYLYNYTNSDYITYNALGSSSGPSTFNGYIAGGQGFFVMMNDGSTTSGTVNFKNNLRSKGYSNSQFYKFSQTGEGEKHRIWLDLVDTNNSVARTLVGYVSEATTGIDRMYDAFKNMANEFSIYSIAEDKTLTIQGRPTPFDSSDTVPIGVRVMQNGSYKIAIAAVDGLFSDASQTIFLEDKLLGITYDLRESPYTFNASAGIINDRFLLRYERNALGNPNFENLDSSVVVSTNEGQMTINSYIENMEEVTVFDLLGRQLSFSKNISRNIFTASDPSVGQQPLIVKIKLNSGLIVTRKILM